MDDHTLANHLKFKQNNLMSGARYMAEGAKLLWHPKLRVYILVPVLINCVLFFVLTATVLSYYWALVDAGNSFIPAWLQPILAPLEWFVWFIIGVVFLIGYAYTFNIITNIIAAPFYGLLSESTEKLVTGKELEPESLGKMLLRVFGRELSKLFYFLGRGILVLLVMILVGFIPVVQVLAPLIGLLWGAWSMAIQYADYAADNHKLPFSDMRKRLAKKSRSSLGFGGCVMGCSVVPFVNIFAMPAAVTGGTLFWLNELSDNPEKKLEQK